VSARVAFMPISQSVRARAPAAAASPSSSSPGRSRAKPVRIASSVIDWSHRRRIGLVLPKWSTISRKISSPSRPASQALTTPSTSSRSSSFLIRRTRAVWPGLGRVLNSNSG
jgi:hypothetical protein